MNGSEEPIEVEDGDVINLEVQTIGDCECCETQRDCSSQSSTLWVYKSNKDRSTIALDKRTLMSKIRMAAKKVRGGGN